MCAKPDRPICLKCNKLVDRFSVGKDFRRKGVCYIESTCHGETERFEYWPVTLEGAEFVPTHAFPADRLPENSFRVTPPPDREPTIPEIMDDLMEMPEQKRLAAIQHFGLSIRVFEGNADELERLLQYLTDDPASMYLSDVKNHAQLNEMFEEVLRLLHNFVAAALTLVDHTRVVSRELYEADRSFPDYQPEVNRRFVHDPLIQFVQKLRHLAQHVRLPQLSYNLELGQSGCHRRLLLHKDDLLRFDGWNAEAKAFIAAAADLIDVLTVVHSYREAVREFYLWMEQRQREIHAPDVAAVEKKRAEGRALVAKEIPSFLASGLAILRQGMGSIRDVFAFAPDDWRNLSHLENDSVAWTEAALALTEKRLGPLPAELVAQIREAARDGR